MQAGAARLPHFHRVGKAGNRSVCSHNDKLHAAQESWSAALAFCVPLDVIAFGLGLLAGLHLH